MATAQTELKVTPEIAAEHGITPEEYARIQKILGRDPNITELGIFSVMWSEHCSYKSSKVHLKRLPTRGKLVVQGPGENAGVVESAMAWSLPSRSNRTIIPAMWSLSRVRHRRRRYPARHLHYGCAADRRSRFAAVRRDRRLRKTPAKKRRQRIGAF